MIKVERSMEIDGTSIKVSNEDVGDPSLTFRFSIGSESVVFDNKEWELLCDLVEENFSMCDNMKVDDSLNKPVKNSED